MTPVLAGRSLEQRKRRQVLPQTVAEIRDAGFFRVLQPRRWGGYEMDLHTFYDIQLALAEGDMSTAWIYGVLGVHPWFMALLDDRAAQEVWGADTSTLICSSLMPAGKATATDGGFRLTGHWRYASACAHCDWALVGAWSHRRPGERRRAASSLCRAGNTARSTLGRSRACRRPAASTSFSTTCSCQPIAPRR